MTDCCGMWAKREQRSKVMSKYFSYQSNDDAKINVDAAIQKDGRSHCPRKGAADKDQIKTERNQ